MFLGSYRQFWQQGSWSLESRDTTRAVWERKDARLYFSLFACQHTRAFKSWESAPKVEQQLATTKPCWISLSPMNLAKEEDQGGAGARHQWKFVATAFRWEHELTLRTRDTTPDESAGPKDTYKLGLPVSRYRHACWSTQYLLAFLFVRWLLLFPQHFSKCQQNISENTGRPGLLKRLKKLNQNILKLSLGNFLRLAKIAGCSEGGQEHVS